MQELAPWLNRIAIALGLWGLFVAGDAAMRLLMIVPVLGLGLALVFRREISLEEEKDEDAAAHGGNAAEPARPNLNAMLFAPGAALAARAFFDLQFVDWSTPLLWSAAAGVTLTALAAWADPPLRTHVWSFVFMLVFMTAYAFGALAHANKFYDTSEGKRFETTVDDHRTRKPVRRTSLENHYVEVAPWGPIATVDEVRVDEDLYDRLKPGDKLCVTLHPGRFGWPWYEAKACA